MAQRSIMREVLRIMNLAQSLQMEVMDINQMVRMVYQLETLGDAREQTLMYMRMIFPEIDKSLTKLFEMRLEMKKLFPPEQTVM